MRLFKARLEIMAGSMRGRPRAARAVNLADLSTEAGVRRATAEMLHREVAAMNPENFVVRPKRRLVEKYAEAETWTSLSAEAFAELSREVAGCRRSWTRKRKRPSG